MPNPVKLHPAASWCATAVDAIPLDLSSGDVDLTDPAGPTGGYCARAILIGSTAGNLKVDTLVGAARVIPVAANQRVDQTVRNVYSTANGTTAALVIALL